MIRFFCLKVVQVHGGYQFNGSSPSLDTYCLTGWVPESILINNPDFKEDETWNQIYQTFTYRILQRKDEDRNGDSIINLATPNSFKGTKILNDKLLATIIGEYKSDDDFDDIVSEQLGLVAGHSYSVLSVCYWLQL